MFHIRFGESKRQYKDTQAEDKTVGEYKAELEVLKAKLEAAKSKFSSTTPGSISWEVDALPAQITEIDARITRLGALDQGKKVEEFDHDEQELLIEARQLQKDGIWEKGRLDLLERYLDGDTALGKERRRTGGPRVKKIETQEQALSDLRDKAVAMVFKDVPIEKAADRSFFEERWKKTVEVIVKNDSTLHGSVLEAASLTDPNAAKAELEELSKGYFDQAFEEYRRGAQGAFTRDQMSKHPERATQDPSGGFWSNAGQQFKKRIIPGGISGALLTGAQFVGDRFLGMGRKAVTATTFAAIGAYAAMRGQGMRDAKLQVIAHGLKKDGKGMDDLMGAAWTDGMGKRWGGVVSESRARRKDLRDWREKTAASAAVSAPDKDDVYKLIELSGKSSLTGAEKLQRGTLLTSEIDKVKDLIVEAYKMKMRDVERMPGRSAADKQTKEEARGKLLFEMQAQMERVSTDAVAQETGLNEEKRNAFGNTYRRLEGIAAGQEESPKWLRALAGASLSVANSWYLLADGGGLGMIWGGVRSAREAVAREKMAAHTESKAVKPVERISHELDAFSAAGVTFDLVNKADWSDAANNSVKDSYVNCNKAIIEARARMRLPDVNEADRVGIEKKIRELEAKMGEMQRTEKMSQINASSRKKTQEMFLKMAEDTKLKVAGVSDTSRAILKDYGAEKAARSKEGWFRFMVHLAHKDRKAFKRVMGSVMGGMAGGYVGGTLAGAATGVGLHATGLTEEYTGVPQWMQKYLEKPEAPSSTTTLPEVQVHPPSSPAHYDVTVREEGSIWGSAHDILQAHATEMGVDKAAWQSEVDAGHTKLDYPAWLNQETNEFVIDFKDHHGGDIKDLIHEKDTILFDKDTAGKWHLDFKESSGIAAGHLSDENVTGEALKTPQGFDLDQRVEAHPITSQMDDRGLDIALPNGEHVTVFDADRDGFYEVNGKEMSADLYHKFMQEQGAYVPHPATPANENIGLRYRPEYHAPSAVEGGIGIHIPEYEYVPHPVAPAGQELGRFADALGTTYKGMIPGAHPEALKGVDWQHMLPQDISAKSIGGVDRHLDDMHRTIQAFEKQWQPLADNSDIDPGQAAQLKDYLAGLKNMDRLVADAQQQLDQFHDQMDHAMKMAKDMGAGWKYRDGVPADMGWKHGTPTGEELERLHSALPVNSQERSILEKYATEHSSAVNKPGILGRAAVATIGEHHQALGSELDKSVGVWDTLMSDKATGAQKVDALRNEVLDKHTQTMNGYAFTRDGDAIFVVNNSGQRVEITPENVGYIKGDFEQAWQRLHGGTLSKYDSLAGPPPTMPGVDAHLVSEQAAAHAADTVSPSSGAEVKYDFGKAFTSLNTDDLDLVKGNAQDMINLSGTEFGKIAANAGMSEADFRRGFELIVKGVDAKDGTFIVNNAQDLKNADGALDAIITGYGETSSIGQYLRRLQESLEQSLKKPDT